MKSIIITVDRNHCEGKAVCLSACPEKVFELREPDPSELSLVSKLKLRFHGGKQAFAVRPENCTACMKCVEQCPEHAIAVSVTDEA